MNSFVFSVQNIRTKGSVSYCLNKKNVFYQEFANEILLKITIDDCEEQPPKGAYGRG